METVIPYEAIAYLAHKGLNPAWHWYEVYANEHQHAFTVAKIMETDILGAIHKKVVQAVENGETFYEFKKNLLEKLGESGWGNYKEKDRMTGETITRLSDSRLRKIYETNTTQAYHAGAWRGFEETKDALPYLEYKLGPSVNHRDSHAQFNGLILKVDDPFWDTHMPMNGWGCKCWVRQLTEAQAKAKGISKSPKIDYHEWVNPSTGEVKKVPKGLSPGFEYNVGKGKARKQNAQNLLKEKNAQLAQAQQESKALVDERREFIKQHRKEVFKYAKAYLLGKQVRHKDIEKPITFTSKGLKEAINQPHNDLWEKNELIKTIDEIIPKAEYVGKSEDTKGRDVVYYYLKIIINGGDAFIVLKENKNGVIFYTITDKFKGMKK